MAQVGDVSVPRQTGSAQTLRPDLVRPSLDRRAVMAVRA